MELKLYLRILKKHWWIVLATFLLTFSATLLFISRQPLIYEATATAIVRPYASAIANDEDMIRVLDTLSRRVEISTTYAEVASSLLMKEKAIEQLDLSAQQQKGLRVSSKVIAGANILEISVRGPDPAIVRDFANALSEETFAYVNNLYGIFELEPLDRAIFPNRPSSPNKMLNLVTGALLGLVLGVGLAFFLEYLQQPESKVDTGYNIIERETGVYNQAYLLLRMKEEMSRTVHTHITFSLALIRLAYYAPVKGPSLLLPPAKAGRMITAALEQIRRDEDILARLDDKNLCHTTFALLMPNVSETAVQEMLDSLRLKIVNLSVENADSDEKYMVYSVMGIATYQGEQIMVQEMLAQATHALAEAETAVNSPIKFYQTTTMLPPITNQIVPEGG